MEAAMLFATLATVIAAIIAVRVAVLALHVARRSAQSADDAHERTVRLQARTALAEARGSFNKLATACHVNQELWRKHRLTSGPVLSATPFAPTQEMREISSLRKQGFEVLQLVVGKFQDIDQMAPECLEDAIPKIYHATSEIEALMERLREPTGSYH